MTSKADKACRLTRHASVPRAGDSRGCVVVSGRTHRSIFRMRHNIAGGGSPLPKTAARMLLVALLCLPPVSSYSQPEPRSPREYRTVNTDVYELVLQRNGAFSVKDLRGTSFFVNAAPYVYFAGQTRPHRLQTSASASVRMQFHDPLGQGQGISLISRECEWRVHAYPGKPYFSVHLVYRNSGRNPVVVAGLSPWRSDPRANGAVVLGPVADTRGAFAAFSGDSPTPFIGRGLLALHNTRTQRSLIAGFLTHHRGDTLLRVASRLPASLPAPPFFSGTIDETGEDAAPSPDAHPGFEAVIIFDPPITVPPGGALEAEPLYVSVGDADPAEGLQRFGLAVAVTHALPRLKAIPTSGLFRPQPLDAASVNREALMEAVRFQAEHLSLAGWRHLYLQEAAALALIENGSGNDRPRLQAMAAEYDLGLGVDLRLFSVPDGMPPQWRLPLSVTPGTAREETLSSTSSVPAGRNDPSDASEVRHTINPALPEVQAWLRDQARTWIDTHGFSVLVLTDAHLIFQSDIPAEWAVSRVQAYRLGLRAIREGMGDRGLLLVSNWHPAALGLAHGAVQHPVHCAQAAKTSKPYQAYQACLPPVFFARVTPPLHLDFPLQEDASRHARQILNTQAVRAAFSGTALRVSVGDGLPDVQAMEPLVRLTPFLQQTEAWHIPPPLAAFPILHATCRASGGAWRLVACINPSKTERSILRLDPGALNIGRGPFTFYEYLPSVHHGLLSDPIDIALEPGESRLFSLRPYGGVPVLLAYDRHLTQTNAMDRRVAWDEADRTLTGAFDAAPDRYRLVFLVPPPYRFRQADLSGGTPAVTSPEEDIVVVEFTVQNSQEISWKLHFDRS